MEPKHLKRGDACPRCGAHEWRAARIPTDAEYAKAFDRENSGSLPDGCDTASPAQRADLGDLYRCGSCGYQTRFMPEAAAAAPAAN